jgi:hypothetical protein
LAIDNQQKIFRSALRVLGANEIGAKLSDVDS